MARILTACKMAASNAVLTNMISHCISATPLGVAAHLVDVEVDVQGGLPRFDLVGLASTAVKESRERVRAAIRNTGFKLEPRAVTVNLAPADLPKGTNHLDLGIACCLLAAHGEIRQEALDGRLFCGELGLNGELRPVRGALAISELASQFGIREVLLPYEDRRLAAEVHGLAVIGARSLTEVVQHLLGTQLLDRAAPHRAPAARVPAVDLADVRGQQAAKRALEIAAAGGHNLLFNGPPGAGKTMLARSLPGLLPPLSPTEAIEVTKIHSLTSATPPRQLLQNRPFRSPHSDTSVAGLVGGGSSPRPGEVSLAHRGVLFLDELPQFRKQALENLRQPLEDGEVSIVRSKMRVTYPSRFTLIAAMNPCPCGYHGDSRRDCRCGEEGRRRYVERLSGPLLDRIDMHLEIPAVRSSDLGAAASETSEDVRLRVDAARRKQAERYPQSGSTNASLTARGSLELIEAESEVGEILRQAYDRLGLSLRSLSKAARVARTISDLSGTESIEKPHVQEALQYRHVQ